MANKQSFPGLSNEEVLARVARGEVNHDAPLTTRTFKQIFLENSLTLFNFINLIIASFIVYTGSYKNLLFLGVIISNTLIGIYQEMRAKKNVDKLTLLNQGKVTVIRDYEEQEIYQNEVVKDDLLLIRRGQQIVVDGVIIETHSMECDESQLTGESLPIVKTVNSEVFSGSFVVSGSGIMQATKVGSESFSYKLAIEAKQNQSVYSELIMMMKRLIRILSMVIIPIGATLMLTSLFDGSRLDEAILGSTGAVIGMIPEGLVLLTSVALAVGVIQLTKQQVLVQTMGAIETLARVDVLCLDKTGTLTSGFLKVVAFHSLQSTVSQDDFYETVGRINQALNEDNATGQALTDYFVPDNHDVIILNQVPFSSARKWSAVSIEGDGSFYLGAPEFMFAHFSKKEQQIINSGIHQGLRIIAVAKSSQSQVSVDLPDDLMLQGFIFLEDEIRKEAPQTLAYFKKQGVDICVISGDHPETVTQISERAGISKEAKTIDMSQVKMEDIPAVVKEYRIFGRVSPEQKKVIIESLQAEDHVVGMTGDGVNDILALKQSDCSIVMANGSDAAKGIADFVLLDSNFDSMVDVVLEGRKVINNIQRVASLYLTKTVYSLILATIFIFLSSSYPFQPIQLSPINALTVGIPSFFLALRPNVAPIKGKFLPNVFEPSLASGMSVVIMTLTVEIVGYFLSWSYEEKSTIIVLLTGLIGFVILSYVARPLTWKIKLLISILAILFASIFLFFGNFFALTSLWRIDLAVVYIPLMFLTYPLFYFLKKQIHLIFQRIEKRRLA